MTISVSDLNPGTNYCAEVEAVNVSGTAYSEQVQFTAGVPAVSTDTATVNSDGTATVSGTVNPAAQSTSYDVEWDLANSVWCANGGTVGSPANTTAATPLGAVDSSDHQVSVDLTGLDGGTSYCAQLVATNTSGSGDGGTVLFSTGGTSSTTGGGGGSSGSGGSGASAVAAAGPGAGLALVGAAKVTGHSVGARVSCEGAVTTSCDFTVELTAVEKLSGGRVVGVSASKRRRPKTTTRTIVLATAAVQLAGGQSEVVHLVLSSSGASLLARHHSWSVDLSAIEAGHVLSTRTIRFAPVSKAKH